MHDARRRAVVGASLVKWKNLDPSVVEDEGAFAEDHVVARFQPFDLPIFAEKLAAVKRGRGDVSSLKAFSAKELRRFLSVKADSTCSERSENVGDLLFTVLGRDKARVIRPSNAAVRTANIGQFEARENLHKAPSKV